MKTLFIFIRLQHFEYLENLILMFSNRLNKKNKKTLYDVSPTINNTFLSVESYKIRTNIYLSSFKNSPKRSLSKIQMASPSSKQSCTYTQTKEIMNILTHSNYVTSLMTGY